MHNTAYSTLAAQGIPVRLVAVCDKSAERINAKSSINIGEDSTTLSADVHLYTDIDRLLSEESFEVADICLPSFLHADVAVKCLMAKKHVLCEKPMALSSSESKRMLAAERESGCRLMIGHCLRFMPEYVYLRECIDDGRFGAMESISMHRHSVYPTWGAERWHDDKSKCGGCLIDTHIHDVDVARYLLGEPDRVSAVAFENVPRYQHVNTRLHFGNVTAVIDGSWDASHTEIFRAGYQARFDRATVCFDFKSVTVFPSDGEPYEPEILPADSYTEEIRSFIESVMNDRECLHTAESSHKSLLLIEAIAESAERSGEYIEF